ncbi:SRPBCC family protein [Agrobacterium tumefaciens]|uniref:SRPBCC family protein n=1 Tax=Agrobacterium tumefaciens TaxID=358 RepID=UPI00287DBAE3|nr:SRPBCC family protein [Agrobacterium tumefaciens]MDS7597051.1 SRPBCC family protein [Agrobacterium tumefaciens]
MPVMPSKIVHLSIDKPWEEVCDFASNPENMPLWAAGLASGLTHDGDEWIADGGPLGSVRVSFAAKNNLGVIDHVVTMPDGLKVYNALRVTPNGDGAEIAFTLLQLPGMTDDDFARDAGLVKADLETLKSIIEKS